MITAAGNNTMLHKISQQSSDIFSPIMLQENAYYSQNYASNFSQ